MTTINLTPEQAATVIVALCENAKAAFLPTTLELIESDGALGEALAELEALKARIAELEAGNTPPEGCEGWKRSRAWIGPLDERGVHEVRWADCTPGTFSPIHAKAQHGVTFP